MDWAELHARCEQRVRALDKAIGIPDPWNMNTFLDRLEVHRGRPIDLCEMQWTYGDSAGAWQAYADHDVVVYPANTSAVHQDAIILHEVGHMLAGHRGNCVLSEEEAQRRAPDLTPAAFTHLLERAASTGEEYEAEQTAVLILARVARQRPRRSTAGELSRRVAEAFG